MSQTIDNFVFEKSQENEMVEKPYLKRDWIYIPDQNNSGTYSVNQVEFNTQGISSNGKYMNYSEAVLSFPLVITATCSAGTGDFTSTTSNGLTDAILSLKNSHYNLIHSVSVDYSNGNIIQPVPYLNKYIDFKLLSEMSQMDEELDGDLLGYAKDSSTAYGFVDTVGPQGIGLYNNCNHATASPACDLLGIGEIFNDGVRKRLKNFGKMNTGRNLLMYGSDTDYHKATGNNVVYNASATRKVYLYDCTIKLKHINSFFSKIPPVKGAVMKILFTLNNNVSFTIVKDAAGSLTASNFQNTSGDTNPIMFSATGVSVNIPLTNAPAAAPVYTLNNYFGAATPGAFATSIGCGSSALIQGTYNIQMNICKSSVDNSIGHVKTNCRMYVPALQLAPKYEQLYLSQPVRTINYLDYEFQKFTVGAGKNFSQMLTPSTARMKRLIMYVSLSSSANAGIHPLASPFWDGSVSPHVFSNFQISIAGNNIYQNLLVFSYEQFLNEMHNDGLNAGQITGLMSGRIGKQDYENNYKWYCIDLSRRLPEDENVGCSLQVSGIVSSLKELDVYCWIEKEKTLTIDVSNGLRM